ncbi:hypothetical protein PF008_g16537 [Phytophthora fragariae]|uniref:Uncharacterized protein n=1 Tax=Phytophthora fragariae TaxID=53985 RepID=A0A6G0RBC9_9STRA|nr:hypothetical protein PF008_g16537 [Phytophthora fragariae]
MISSLFRMVRRAVLPSMLTVSRAVTTVANSPRKVWGSRKSAFWENSGPTI